MKQDVRLKIPTWISNQKIESDDYFVKRVIQVWLMLCGIIILTTFGFSLLDKLFN